ncbi:MAG: hypothetical protein FKY71_18960 [Spiribacter salinus]|uniref:Novel toxin 10 domain-containing protein n=1 Tax=Spiribacter salinus TaxID=1335746 RepID=A0A540V7U0_9GAMM|nr:MAG: hypothetical protein FKY71_18960 [Spiribacter salinus]
MNFFDPSGLDFVEWRGDEAWWVPESDGFLRNPDRPEQAVRIGTRSSRLEGFIELEPEIAAATGNEFVDFELLNARAKRLLTGDLRGSRIRGRLITDEVDRAAGGSGPNAVGRIFREDARAASNAALAGTADGFVNAAANTVTVGQAGDLRLVTSGAEAVGLEIDEEARSISQTTTRVGGEIVIGIGSGGLGNASRAGQAVRVLDLAQGGSDVVVGSADIAINGANTGNVTQTTLGLVGVSANAAGTIVDAARRQRRAAQQVDVQVNNPVPSRTARVVDAEVLDDAQRLGPPRADDAFVTSADDLAGASSSDEIARRLTLLDSQGQLRSGPFGIIEFDTPSSGIASPIFRNNPGFTGFGQTAGGAPEFVLPNLLIEDLSNVTRRVVP